MDYCLVVQPSQLLLFVIVVLTQLRTENTQFDTYMQVQYFGARYQARTDQLPVLSSLRPGYAALI